MRDEFRFLAQNKHYSSASNAPNGASLRWCAFARDKNHPSNQQRRKLLHQQTLH